MGVRGLQSFVEHACPATCIQVQLKQMAENYQSTHRGQSPVVVVDAMSCLRYWYTSEAWVHGGQWREYIQNIKVFVDAFAAAGIKLVFFFDGVLEQKKMHEWVRRRLQNNQEIARVFQYIKANSCQPGIEMFCIPSALGTFTHFALKSIGLETIRSLEEADYAIANYARVEDCMAILGQDTDYLIFNTAPYISIRKLDLDNMVTTMYSREHLCQALGLHMTDLPVLACLIGNDVVPETMLRRFKHECLARYLPSDPTRRREMVSAVAQFLSGISRSRDGLREVQRSLQAHSAKNLLEIGIESYLLPEQQSPWLPRSKRPSTTKSAMYPDPEILKIARDQHIRAEGSTVYTVLSLREVNCSNTLEDELDRELPGQAIVYRPARQAIYGVLLEAKPSVQSGAARSCPIVKEWYVYPGNSLQQPDLVPALAPKLPGGTPDLRTLWLTKGPEVEKLRFSMFLACFGLQEFAEEMAVLEPPLAATCCLLIYITLQVTTLCLEDMDAYLAQAICLRDKPADILAEIQVPRVVSRAVHLASLFVRGLTVLVSANSACGFPFKTVDLMPWEVFDGKLFHVKYLQSHSQCTMEELLEKKESWVQLFQKLRLLLKTTCERKKRIIQSNPRPHGPETFEGPNQFQLGQRESHTSSYSTHHSGYQGRCPWPSNFDPGKTGRGSQPRRGSHNRRRPFAFKTTWNREELMVDEQFTWRIENNFLFSSGVMRSLTSSEWTDVVLGCR